jgi:predicted ArsR family transcriptional regulator
MTTENAVAQADLPLERDRFLRALLRELSGTLEDVVGLAEAEGFISVVGDTIGRDMNQSYRNTLKVERLDREQIGQVLVDLKRRIKGDFFILEEAEDYVVLGNRKCPFGAYVEGRPSLCMMTSNVFGTITAQNAGYAHVTIDEAIARGDAGCKVTVRFTPADDPAGGREYFGD